MFLITSPFEQAHEQQVKFSAAKHTSWPERSLQIVPKNGTAVHGR